VYIDIRIMFRMFVLPSIIVSRIEVPKEQSGVYLATAVISVITTNWPSTAIARFLPIAVVDYQYRILCIGSYVRDTYNTDA